MDIKEFVANYRNHPVLFIGTGISLRYLDKSFTWDGLLKHTCAEALGSEEKYYDIKSKHPLLEDFDYPAIGQTIETEFNNVLEKDRDGKFKAVNDKFYEAMSKGVRTSRFKIYISDILRSGVENPEISHEIAELKKIRKNIGSIVTTNYDKFIENLFEFEPLIGNDILLSNPYGSVYKIHGCISDPTKIIISSDDYKKFEERHELIRAQLLSIFIHNPIIFLGYKVGDENIKGLLKTIFTYVEPNSKTAEKIRKNFLLVEYEKGSSSQEITDHDIDLRGLAVIRINKIKTDDYISIYRALGDLALPISAMDVRKVQSVVKEIYAGGDIGVKITEDLDTLGNGDKILAIGSKKTIQYHYQTANETMANYFAIIEEANSHVIGLIDKYKIAKNQYFPIFGFDKINPNVTTTSTLKKQQIRKLNEADAAVPEKCQIENNSIDDILNDVNLAASYKSFVIYYSFRKNAISLNDCENYLMNHSKKSSTDYRRLLCAYDFKKYNQKIQEN